LKINRLRPKLIFAVLISSVLLIGSVCISVSYFFRKGIMQNIEDNAIDHAKTLANFVDGDTIDSYLKTGQADDYWYEVNTYIQTTVRNSHLLYYYVFYPEENDIVYIWDSEYSDPQKAMNHHEKYLPQGKAASAAAFSETPVIDIYITLNNELYGNIASVFYPVYDSNGKPVALTGVDLSIPDIDAIIFRFNIKIIISVIGVIILLMVAFYFFVSKQLIRPLKILNKATKLFVRNLDSNETLNLSIHTGDEIQELADSFQSMDGELKNYIQELSSVTAEKERIATELNVATQIQKSMLPSEFPSNEQYEVFASMDPAKEVGGDFYDFFMIDKTHLAVVVADVSGKGVPAALFMVIGKTLIKDHSTSDTDPSLIFETVNNLLCQSNKENLFITAFFGILDITTGEFKFVNAGHNFPFICRKDGTTELLEFKSGLILAAMENVKYQTGSTHLNPGDRLFQYTDGITEAMNPQDELFGMERLTKAIKKTRHLTPEELISSIKSEIENFCQGREQFDDITMLCLDYKAFAK